VRHIGDHTREKSGFTIIELLTVMSIIILLIGLLVPALNRVRRYATRVKQKAQFHAISVALDLFNAEYAGYPDSNARDDDPLGSQPYCGAMKLCEAMVGQDLKGFNPKSRFRYLEINTGSTKYYPNPAPLPTDVTAYDNYNINGRKMYLQLENANAYQLGAIYDPTILSDPAPVAYDPCTFVLCDAYNRVTNRITGRKIGMPILYYKADPSKTVFPLYNAASSVAATLSTYIYDVRDNQGIIEKGIPGTTGYHPLSSTVMTPPYPNLFYNMIRDPIVPTGDRPYRTDSYILLSAGFDGLYGSSDDVFNYGE
jgi:type II secretory pathway pseudopilin PulG